MFCVLRILIFIQLLAVSIGAVSSDTLVTSPTTSVTTNTILLPTTLSLHGDLASDSRVLTYGFAPPLSLNDTIYMIRANLFRLKHYKSGSIDLNRKKMNREMQAVINYVKLLDNRYYTLRDYNWIQLGDQKISMNNPDWDRFSPPLTIKNVSALALRVEQNDVRLLDLEIWEQVKGEKRKIPLELDFKVIQNNKPSAHVVFLNRRIQLILIRSKTEVIKPDAEARLLIEVGITQKPEHAKYANRELKNALRFIETEKDQEAIQSLQNAWHELLKLRDQSKL